MSQIILSSEAKDVLKNAVIDSVKNTLTLPEGQLNRKLYLEINGFLEVLGGKWNKKQKCHIYPNGDWIPVFTSSVKESEIEYVDLKKDLEFFETPPELAQEMVDLAGVDKDSRILEPSIGMGGIAKFCPNRNNVVGLDIHQPFVDAMLKKEYNVYNVDFLTQRASELGMFDAVLMNPPFSNGQDVKHCTHALSFLKAGGFVVALTSKSWTFRKGKVWEEFRNLVKKDGVYSRDIPEGTFKAAGTNIGTVLLVIRKN
jgi:predicted RNA methylase